LPEEFVLNVGPFTLPDLHLLLLVQTQHDVLPQFPCVNSLQDFSKLAPDFVLQNASAIPDIIGTSPVWNPSS
jgi:hypothetical protein